jgi:tetratricopeptide (TPR) repeat protein
MERTRHRLIFLMLILLSGTELYGSYRSEIYYAYVNDKMELWKGVIDRMNAVPEKTDEFLLELVNYQYGYIGYCLGAEKKNEAREYLELAQENINILEKHNYRLPLVNAYNAAFCGFRIGINVLSVPYNGFRSIEYAKKAIELDAGNYLAYVQYGNIQFYMPKSFGGSKKEGVDYYNKAREILEKDKKGLAEDWNYLALLVVIGQSYTYLGDYNSAKAVYDYTLRFEPGFTYVRDELYVQLMEKMKNSDKIKPQ